MTADEMAVMESVRRKWLTRHVNTDVPVALDTLQRCLKQPCDADAYEAAKALVRTWLLYDKAVAMYRVATGSGEKR